MSESKLQLRIFDGSRQLFSNPKNLLVKIIDGNQQQRVWDFFSKNEIIFNLPFYDNLADNYSVVVTADGYKDAGFYPVKLSDKYTLTLDIMLVAKQPGFNFASAPWKTVKKQFPFLAAGVPAAAGETRYEDLLENHESSLACFLNTVEAMSDIPLSQGTPLDYIQQLRWDGNFAPAQDRFFAWCDRSLIDQVRVAATKNLFSEEPAPGLLHPGATHSWKEVHYGEANVQLTFHENDTQKIGTVDCITLEVDVDYYRDPLAHAILEVLPNGLTHSLTNPVEVYVLRWMAGQMARTPEFAPLYIVTS